MMIRNAEIPFLSQVTRCDQLLFLWICFFFIHQIWSQLCSSRGGTESERESWKQKWGATMQTVCARVFGSSQPEISHRRNKTCSFLLLHDCSSMTPHPSSSSQLLLLLLLTQEELFLSCCDGLSSLSLVRDGIRTNPDFQTYITTNSINVMTCEGPTKHSRGCGHVTWTYCHQLRHWGDTSSVIGRTNMKIQTVFKKITWNLQRAADSL